MILLLKEHIAPGQLSIDCCCPRSLLLARPLLMPLVLTLIDCAFALALGRVGLCAEHGHHGGGGDAARQSGVLQQFQTTDVAAGLC